jgi:hypothetical protein
MVPEAVKRVKEAVEQKHIPPSKRGSLLRAGFSPGRLGLHANKTGKFFKKFEKLLDIK